MAILRIDSRDGALGCAPADLERAARDRAAGSPDDAPTVVLVHGFKYDPRDPRFDPHALLYRDGPPPPERNPLGRVASWPQGLGFTEDGPDGLCVGYGWRARASHAACLLRRGRNGFAAVYDEAGRAGGALAPALAALARARSAPVDMFTHSLGARVALSALSRLAEEGRRDVIERLGRWVLLAPAEFSGTARAALAACDRIGARPPEIYGVVARHNARYDALFSLFAPRRARRGAPLGRGGLGAAHPRWLDIAFDDPALVAPLEKRGVRLAPQPAAPCHWAFYLREGAMALHSAILRREPGFGVEALRAAGLPEPGRGPLPRPASAPDPEIALGPEAQPA